MFNDAWTCFIFEMIEMWATQIRKDTLKNLAEIESKKDLEILVMKVACHCSDEC